MRHARPDYNRIQDPDGLIPDDEPVFLLRGQDRCAPDTLRKWAELAELEEAAPAIVEAARRQASAMEKWQCTEKIKTPDLAGA